MSETDNLVDDDNSGRQCHGRDEINQLQIALSWICARKTALVAIVYGIFLLGLSGFLELGFNLFVRRDESRSDIPDCLIGSGIYIVGAIALFYHYKANPDDGNQLNGIRFFSGSLFLLIGCTSFAVFIMVYSILKLLLCGKYCIFEYWLSNDFVDVCNLWDLIVIPGTLFFAMQTYFLVAKGQIRKDRPKLLTSLSLLHVILTNLWVAIRFIVKEKKQIEFLIDLKHADNEQQTFFLLFLTKNSSASCHGVKCVTGHFVEFLYTCFVEYALICFVCSLMVWKRIVNPNGGHAHHIRRHFTWQYIKNPACIGIALLILTISFITFFLAYVHSKVHEEKLAAIYLFNGFEGFLMIFGLLLCVAIISTTLRSANDTRANQRILEGSSRILYWTAFGFTLLFSGGTLFALAYKSSSTWWLIALYALTLVQVLVQALAMWLMEKRVHVDRRANPQVTTLLIAVNLCLFVMDTFEPVQQDDIIEALHAFGHQWIVILLRSLLPIMTFFRFHSCDCFAEILKIKYESISHQLAQPQLQAIDQDVNSDDEDDMH